MKNILFVRSTPYNEDLNGYNVQGVGVAKAFCRLGYNCDYLNYTSKEERIVDLCEINGNKARAIYMKRIRFFRTGICTGALKKEFLDNYDVVICREYNQLMTHLFAKKHSNTSMYSGPYWNMFMLPFMSGVYDALYNRKMNKELKCKFVKSQMAKEFLEAKGYTDLVDVGVGLDTTRFEGVECSESTQKIVDYMKANRCILYVGKLDANKNIQFVIDVFAKVKKEEPDVKLILIGKSKQSWQKQLMGKKNESFYNELIEKVPEDVRNSIWHIQRVENPQLQFVYSNAKAFILPSIHEIFGMVMLEAMYFGAPVITSRNGGSSTLIKSEKYGQSYAEYDTEKWAQGILKYLNDEEYTTEVVNNCKANIRENYTWDIICKKMIDHIEK
ncbi:MAG: glycosyltransferase family 4 protein [Lachnospiraceae bacterium]|nr:glycosyltransferase family 4 protein [Lachnospiraceae bacterium]